MLPAQGFVLSPLNTVGKRDSEERRVIVDLSWPCGHSVNDGIPSDSYLGEPCITLAYNRWHCGYRCCFGSWLSFVQAWPSKVVPPVPSRLQSYPFLGYIWDNHFISTPFSRWDCALQLCGANALLQPLPGSHHNKAVWCLIIWTISSAFSSYDRSIEACIVALITPHK